MNRSVHSISIGGGFRHVSTIKDIPSDGPDIHRRQFEFLQDLACNGVYSKLLHCGPIPFDTMRMYHNGSCWVVELEAIEEK